MNKTISVALAGFSFVIEEHAYIKLNDYLQALRRSLEKEEVEEVMYDIEIRIAEIFSASIGKREVVIVEDVDAVIAQIGTPEAIEEQEEAYYSEKTSSKKKNHNRGETRQLFRDIEGAKISGVCAGFAHYFGVDVTIMRVIWLLSMLITGFFPIIVLYIILALAMPKAKTTSDILKMKGKPIDFEHIKEESRRFANESGQKIGTFLKDNQPNILKTGDRLLHILRKLIGGLFALFAIKFALIGILSATDMLGVFNIFGMDKLDLIFEEDAKYILMGLILLGFSILTLIFSALSIKLFSPKTKIRNFGYIILVLFIALIGTAGVLGIKTSDISVFYAGESYEEENIQVNAVNNKIELDVKRINIPQNFKAYGYDIFSDKNKIFKKDIPNVEIVRKVGIEKPYLVIKKEAKGYNHPIRLNVPVEIKNGKVLFPNYIGYSYSHRLRDYEVDYELIVPIGIQVIDHSRGALYIDDDDDVQDLDYFPQSRDLGIENPNDSIITGRQ